MNGLHVMMLIDGALAVILARWLYWRLRSRRATQASDTRAVPGTRSRRRTPPPDLVADPPHPRPQKLNSYRGRVYVIDGDTIEVNRSRVRLFGMDAPELSQRGGGKAKSHLISLAGGKAVRVEPVTVDCYGRIVARVWLGDVDLSGAMVRDGYAVAMGNWHRDYVASEREARAARRGLWAFDPRHGINDPAAHRRREAGRGDPRASNVIAIWPAR